MTEPAAPDEPGPEPETDPPETDEPPLPPQKPHRVPVTT